MELESEGVWMMTISLELEVQGLRGSGGFLFVYFPRFGD
jgi:hypothetical protein